MRITVLSGGVGGARFLTGLQAVVPPGTEITVIGNTADDIWLFGLRVCPDLDTVMYTLGGGIDPERGWGRGAETWQARAELAAYGAEPTWFGLGDRDLATHILRTQLLRAGEPLSQVTRRLCERWRPGVDLLPMADDEVETWVTVADPAEPDGRRRVHFQEYWVGLGAPPALEVTAVGASDATPAPGVLESIGDADLILLPPSNPVVSIGTILAVPGIRTALAETVAPVVGVSPIVSGAPLRGMADRVLPAIGVEVSAAAVGLHYGARSAGGLLDGWLVDSADAAAVDDVTRADIRTEARPILMTGRRATAEVAAAALDLGRRLAGAA